jgi:periplasmic divalent cation tolerance protein
MESNAKKFNIRLDKIFRLLFEMLEFITVKNIQFQQRPPMTLIALHTTVATEEEALALAHAVVQARLAACVQTEAIQSVYRWQGTVHTEKEWRLSMKTTQAKSADLMAFVQTHHPYEVPAIYTVEVLDATPAYADWVAEETR